MRLLICAVLAASIFVPASATPSPTTAPTTASAATALTHAPGSTLGFASSYDGEAFEGRFARFTTRIAFDPVSATGRFDVGIDLASANTENDERDEVLLGEDFFNVLAVPQARYVAERFRRLPDGRFVAEGTLSLRGISSPVPLTFRWTPGAAPVLDGSASVPRLTFNVGTGDWDDTEALPDAVMVTTRLVLRPE
jgi:polyisoprenoid-binding protein YceI